MKRGTKIILIILFILGLLFAAYKLINPKDALKIILPEVDEISNVHIKLLRDTAVIELDMKIENSSFFKLNIDSLFYRVVLDTSTILSKEEYLNVVMEPGDVDTVHFPVKLPSKRLQKQIRGLQGTDSVDVDIHVRVVYATIFGKTVLPYAKKMRIAVPKPPKIEILKTEFVKRDKKTFYVNAHVKIHNYGKIDLKISHLHYIMKVEDLFTVTDKYGKEMVIEPGSHHTFILPLKIEVKRLFRTAMLVVTDNDMVKYRLKVTAFIETNKETGEKTPIEIEKDGVMELKK